jgi:uncharacterized protein
VHPRQHLALLLSMAAFGSTGAWASDIQCATTRQPAERVICDHAILNNEYDDIVAQQRTLLSAGKLSPEQLAKWRQSRNACTDVHCIDTVFAQWKSVAKSGAAISREPPAPVMASATDMAPVGPASDAGPVPASQASQASQASPTSEASLVRQGSAAGVALPQPVATQASSPAVASAAASEANGTHSTGVLSAVALLVIGFIALIALRKRSRRRTGEP